jgi:N-acetylglucosaminyldiphosphoundecaprenol N-acetyl-beta-D-mannosaminyltransferase
MDAAQSPSSEEQVAAGGSPTLPARRDVVGTPVSLTSYAEVLDLMARRPADRPLSFAFCNVHSVMTARRDPELARVLRGFDVATPDGVPLTWALRGLGHRGQQRVYGPDLMEYALPHGVPLGWRHYFYGATSETLAALRAAAERLAPGIEIVGAHAPPFRPETPEERAAVLADIRDSGADILWVGLGMPKQEHWVDEVREELPGIALMAVGAAFDLLSGTVKQAPDWIQRAGLEWLYRLSQEPRRLWRRYLYNNPAFVLAFARQLVGERRR